MRKLVVKALAVLTMAEVESTPVFTGIGNKIPDNGQHYNLNVIGVSLNKTTDMTGSNHHTIFIPLGNNDKVDC